MRQRRPRSQPTHGVINSPPPPLPEEAFKFVTLLKEYNREVYVRFLFILRDYVQQRSNASGIMSRIEQLFENHSELREAFSSLKMDIRMTTYIKKLQTRLAINDNQRYLAYFEILDGFRSGQKSMIEMVEEIAVLFADHMDLFLDFCGFLPDDIPQ